MCLSCGELTINFKSTNILNALELGYYINFFLKKVSSIYSVPKIYLLVNTRPFIKCSFMHSFSSQVNITVFLKQL